MSFEELTLDKLIAESLSIKAEIQKLREKRLAIKAEIAKRNAVVAVRAKLGSLSDTEKNILKKELGNVTVTPGPAEINLKGR